MPDYPINGLGADTLRGFLVTIPNGTAKSEMFCPQGQIIVGIVMPTAWTAASLGYATCLTGRDGDLVQVYDAGGNPEKTTVAASHNISIPQSDAVYTPWMQILSVDATDGTTPVNQGAARTILLLLRSFLK